MQSAPCHVNYQRVHGYIVIVFTWRRFSRPRQNYTNTAVIHSLSPPLPHLASQHCKVQLGGIECDKIVGNINQKQEHQGYQEKNEEGS